MKKNLLILLETVILVAAFVVAGVVAAMFRTGALDVNAFMDAILQRDGRVVASSEAVPVDDEAMPLRSDGTMLKLLSMTNIVYTKEEADEAFPSMYRVGVLADKLGSKADNGYAEGASWVVESTMEPMGIDGIYWTSYSFLVAMNDGSRTNGTVSTRSDSLQRYARTFSIEIAKAAEAETGSGIADLNLNRLVPTGRGSGEVDVVVSYDGVSKRVRCGVHPVYAEDRK